MSDENGAAEELKSDDTAGGAVDAEVVDPAEPIRAELADGPAVPRKRRVKLPIFLFIATCVSCFWVGAMRWLPISLARGPFDSDGFRHYRQSLLRDWDTGLIYMGCVLAILLTHEMGHFVATVCHRVRASLPFFLPLPITSIGTLGAVIVMDHRNADRRQMFDIGIAGPLAGLVVALPVMWYGVATLDLTKPASGPLGFESPLAVQWMLEYLQPPGYESGSQVWINQLNPFFMAGWVGLLITGLNMMPVSQLDGGHVVYTLFGKRAHWVARGFLAASIAYVVFAGVMIWVLMIGLVLLIGTDHPPTRDDSVPLGPVRTALGLASLIIPIVCFAPKAIVYQ